ncbi:MAG: CooT family nickel-binding protein [Clostridia bacterium]|nr:CooT family nickel-binding protein [Clostridia bacterium]
MCLSTVYLLDGEEEVKLADNIGGVDIQGDQVIMTDLLGIRTAVAARIETIDLIDNYIILKRPAL